MSNYNCIHGVYLGDYCAACEQAGAEKQLVQESTIGKIKEDVVFIKKKYSKIYNALEFKWNAIKEREYAELGRRIDKIGLSPKERENVCHAICTIETLLKRGQIK